MQRQPWSKKIDCPSCELPTQERLNYFTGQFLTERDFRDEQTYLRGKQLQHNRYLHGWGTVCGLKVTQHPNPVCRDRLLVIEPGLALDCCGREIVIQDCVYVDLIEALAGEPLDQPEPGNDEDETPTPSNLLISLCYQECKTEFVPALYSDCGCDQTGYGANRVREGFDIVVTPVDQLPPPGPSAETVGVRLTWQTTLNQARTIGLALDASRQRLYVLSAADLNQIMVYDTENHCLLGSLDVGSEGDRENEIFYEGIDLALAPTGSSLYLIYHNPNSQAYGLRVLEVNDLSTPEVVNDLPLNSGQLENPPKIAVAFADGRVYTLDPNADPAVITIWTTDINTPGLADPTTAIYATVPVDASSPSLAVSPDGAWLFFVPPATTNQLTAARVETLSMSENSWETYPLDLSGDPVGMAVSGDSSRLYVATEFPGLEGFRIQTSPEAFPATGSVSWEDETVVDLAVSPVGKWVYLLLRDSENQGWIRVVNGERMTSDPETAVSDPTKVLANPQDVLLNPEGRVLYVAGLGLDTDPCGGVSILDVNEAPCREILWQSLEGCPECPENVCVPLAIIENYIEGNPVTDADIDNRIRPLVPSTNTLKKLILCALDNDTRQQGPEGPQGPPGEDGEDGEDGKDGFGLNPDLPKIMDIGWPHNESVRWEEFLDRLNYDLDPSEVFNSEDAIRRRGLFTIYFNKEMTGINRQTFRVWVDYPGVLTTVIDPPSTFRSTFSGLYNYISVNNFPLNFELKLYGEILPLPNGPHLTPNTNESSPWAVTFIPHKNSFASSFPILSFILLLVRQALQQEEPENLTDLDLPTVHICLKGDFVHTLGELSEDELENQILDADNIAGLIGTNRDRGGQIQGGRNPSGNLTKGGDFESWFFLIPPENNVNENPSPIDDLTNFSDRLSDINVNPNLSVFADLRIRGEGRR